MLSSTCDSAAFALLPIHLILPLSKSANKESKPFRLKDVPPIKYELNPLRYFAQDMPMKRHRQNLEQIIGGRLKPA